MRIATAAALVLTAGLAAPSVAQPVIDFREELPAERPEAWAMRWFAAALAPSGFGAPGGRVAGSVELAAEVGWLPELSERERTVGFNGTKTEDLNRSPLFGRIRAEVGLGRGFLARVGWIPPVEVDGLRPNLLSLALARPIFARGRFRLGGALVADWGEISGDLTCDVASAAAGDDPVANPFGCEAPSEDEQRFSSFGLEAVASWGLGASRRWQASLAASVRRLDAELRVDARYSGLVDRSVLAYEGTEWTVGAGLSRAVSERTRLALDAVYAPLQVVRDPFGRAPSENDPLINVRFLVGWRVR
jgi:hypothetical protein